MPLHRRPCIALLVGAMVLGGVAAQAAAGGATDRVRGFFAEVNRVIVDPAYDARPEERLVAVRRLVTDMVDFRHAAAIALGSEWAARSPGDREEFVRLFTTLLETSLFASVGAKARLDGGIGVTYVAETVHDDVTTVATTVLTRSDRALAVDYRMRQRGSRWVVHDVVLDGVSLVENYRAQFQKVMQRSSYEALVTEMRSRTADLAPRESTTVAGAPPAPTARVLPDSAAAAPPAVARLLPAPATVGATMAARVLPDPAGAGAPSAARVLPEPASAGAPSAARVLPELATAGAATVVRVSPAVAPSEPRGLVVVEQRGPVEETQRAPVAAVVSLALADTTAIDQAAARGKMAAVRPADAARPAEAARAAEATRPAEGARSVDTTRSADAGRSAAATAATRPAEPARSGETVRTAESARPDGFWVQVGAFRSGEKAMQVVAALRDQAVSLFTVPNDPLLRVVVGPFASRESAAAKLREMRARGYEAFIPVLAR